MQQYADVVTDLHGNVVPRAIVSIFNLDGSLASLYAPNESTPIANPVVADDHGYFTFKAANGNYKRSVTASGITTAIPGEIVLTNGAGVGSGTAPTTASAIANVASGNLSAATVQAAINELDNEKIGVVQLAGAGGAGIVGNTPAGNLTATTVQAALNELDNEKVALQRLALATGAELVGYQPNNGALTTVQHMLEAYATDGGGSPSGAPAFAAVTVNKVRTTINIHAFEDWSLLNTTDTNLGYAAFDAKPTMNNGQDQEHFVGFQSRPQYVGAGNLTSYLDGLNSACVHNGTGTVFNHNGVKISDLGGTGPVFNSIGLFIAPITRGSNTNYGVYVAGGINHFADRVELPAISCSSADGQLGILLDADVAGKGISYGFSRGGFANFATHIFYDGKNSVGMTLSSTGLLVNQQLRSLDKLYSEKAMRPGVFTFATLPTGVVGEMIYVSNGRKVGEASGAGTGVPCYYSGGGWRVFSTDAIVTV